MKIDLPQNIDQWLDELARAYADAQEAIPFGVFVGTNITEDQLFQLAPHVAIKFRGIKNSKANVGKATEAALSTYVANKDREGLPMKDPLMCFSLCYLASHLGLGLLSAEETEHILLQVEEKRNELSNLIHKFNKPTAFPRASKRH